MGCASECRAHEPTELTPGQRTLYMPLVVGVSFRKVGKVYYFDPVEFALNEGDFVIAETARGMEFGEVVLEPREVAETDLVAPLKRIVRLASGDDLQREAANREREIHAFQVCQTKIADHGLPMKLLEAEYAFDGSQVTFSFSADGRIDFRELVKDVAGALRIKVQLHQIGVRDEAKLIGGYGTCGRPLCCSTFLSSFDPISMKMAKDQSLFLNPAKFSGCCGKLMCCLRYEHEFYKEAQLSMPLVGAILPLEQGRGKVIDVNYVSGEITVQTEEGVQFHLPASGIDMRGMCRRHGIGCNMSDSHCHPICLDGQDCSRIDEEIEAEDVIADDDPPADIDDAVHIVETTSHDQGSGRKSNKGRFNKHQNGQAGNGGKRAGRLVRRRKTNGNSANDERESRFQPNGDQD